MQTHQHCGLTFTVVVAVVIAVVVAVAVAIAIAVAVTHWPSWIFSRQVYRTTSISMPQTCGHWPSETRRGPRIPFEPTASARKNGRCFADVGNLTMGGS